MNREGIRYGNYKEYLGDNYYIEKILLMNSVAWTFYRITTVEGPGGMNIEGVEHPGIQDKITLFWSNSEDAEERTRDLAQSMLNMESFD